MKILIVLCMLMLCGCADKEMTKMVLSDIQTCDRHYTGAIAVGTAGLSDSATFALDINCKAMPGVIGGSTTTTVTTPPVVKPPGQ